MRIITTFELSPENRQFITDNNIKIKSFLNKLIDDYRNKK
jgi:hypothetical protein